MTPWRDADFAGMDAEIATVVDLLVFHLSADAHDEAAAGGYAAFLRETFQTTLTGVLALYGYEVLRRRSDQPTPNEVTA